MKILVAYASRHGATGEIAEKIGSILQTRGYTTDISPMDAVTDLHAYDCLVLGSAIYAGKWMKPVMEVLEKEADWLAQKSVWLFSSGPTGAGDATALLQGWIAPEDLRPLFDRIKPRGVALFHGAIDPDKLNFAEKEIVRKFNAPVGDFRNWKEIMDWAYKIQPELDVMPT